MDALDMLLDDAVDEDTPNPAGGETMPGDAQKAVADCDMNAEEEEEGGGPSENEVASHFKFRCSFPRRSTHVLACPRVATSP